MLPLQKIRVEIVAFLTSKTIFIGPVESVLLPAYVLSLKVTNDYYKLKEINLASFSKLIGDEGFKNPVY